MKRRTLRSGKSSMSLRLTTRAEIGIDDPFHVLSKQVLPADQERRRFLCQLKQAVIDAEKT